MALLEFLILAFFTGLIILGFMARNNMLGALTLMESDETTCPNCGNTVDALPYGRHRCGKCDFVYDVNRLSRSKKYDKQLLLP